MENKNESNSGAIVTASPVPVGIAMEANSHSVGLMFEQSVLQQQNQFQVGLSGSVLNFKKISNGKTNIKGLRKSRFDL